MTAILAISGESLKIASLTLILPAAIWRFIAARARRTSLARRSACKRCAPRAAGEAMPARPDAENRSVTEM
jgi:hypothetical protein